MPVALLEKMLSQCLRLALIVVPFCIAVAEQNPWQWAFLSGSERSFANNELATFRDFPSITGLRNAWTSADGDFYVLENRKDTYETIFWKWTADSSEWKVLSKTKQERKVYKPPSRPANVDATSTFKPPPREYEQADEDTVASGLKAGISSDITGDQSISKKEVEDDIATSSKVGSTPKDVHGDSQLNGVTLAVREKGQENYVPHVANAQGGKPNGREPEAANSFGSPQSGAASQFVLPEAPLNAATAVDRYGDRFFMFGGRGGLSLQRGTYLWMYEVKKRKWTLLSGGPLDYSKPVCHPVERMSSPLRFDLGPCSDQVSGGYETLMYSHKTLFVLSQYSAQKTQGGLPQTAFQLWQFSLGTKRWEYIDVPNDGTPPLGTYAVKTFGVATANTLWMYRPFFALGGTNSTGGSQVVGEMWRYSLKQNRWILSRAPALPLENCATWLWGRYMITYIPGSFQAGASSKRRAPAIPGVTKDANGRTALIERLVAFDMMTGKYFALERPEVSAAALNYSIMSEFDSSNTPQRRFKGVVTGTMAFAAKTSNSSTTLGLYMMGGSLSHKRNPERRNDLWQMKLNLEALVAGGSS